MGRKRQQKSDAINTADKQPTLWQIAVYIRLSRDDGREESESVINQKKILKEFLKEYFEGQYTVADFYIDDGLSGTDDSRADFMRMVQDIEQGKVNCVVCKTLSRAFRNYSDQGYYLEYYFPQKSVRFISTGDPKIDTYLNPEIITGMEVPITGLMNDRFAAKTSSDIRRTFDTKRRNGEFIGAFPPYGYLKSPNNKNQLILDESIVPIKRDILHWIVDKGMSLRGIAQRLNELGIPNPSAYKRSKGWNYFNPRAKENDGLWTGTTVRRMMLDKVNIGHMVQGKQRVVSYKVHDKVPVPKHEWFVKENTHEPTFTKEEYDTMARLLAQDTRSPNGKRTVHLFSGFLKCKDCGKALQRKSSKNIVYYACRTYTEKSKIKCTRHSIRLDVLEKAVLAAIQAQIMLIDSVSKMVDELNHLPVISTKAKHIENLLAEKRQDSKKLRRLSDGLYMDWKSGDINHEDYRRMKVRFEEQIFQTENILIHLAGEQQRMAQHANTENAAFTDFIKNKNITRLNRSLLVQLVDTIYVHTNKEITIVFRFQDEIKRIFKTAKMSATSQKVN